LKVLSGTEEDGEEVGTHKRPNGYKTNMSVSPWVNNYNNGWEVKAVKVYKGCTLQAFKKDDFKERLGALNGPSSKWRTVEEYVNGKFEWATKMQSWKCTCHPHY